MAEQVDVKRKIFGKTSFTNVVDTSFKQLIPPQATPVLSNTVAVTDFFSNYDAIFYDIPASGSSNSHLELVNRSSAYLGISYADLLEELRVTRNDNASLKNQLFVLTGV